jgi:hypothetical protein
MQGQQVRRQVVHCVELVVPGLSPIFTILAMFARRQQVG